jgi:hypothetical protein
MKNILNISCIENQYILRRTLQTFSKITAAKRKLTDSFCEKSRPARGFLLNGYREYFLAAKLTTHLYLVERLRMTGAMPLIPQYAFVTHTGTSCIFGFLRENTGY